MNQGRAVRRYSTARGESIKSRETLWWHDILWWRQICFPLVLRFYRSNGSMFENSKCSTQGILKTMMFSNQRVNNHQIICDGARLTRRLITANVRNVNYLGYVIPCICILWNLGIRPDAFAKLRGTSLDMPRILRISSVPNTSSSDLRTPRNRSYLSRYWTQVP